MMADTLEPLNHVWTHRLPMDDRMTDTPAAFQATYSDWTLLKGRKQVRIGFEVPVELADIAYQALGGMPDPSRSVWCGIARLTEEVPSENIGTTTSPTSVPTKPRSAAARPAGAKRSWGDMTPAQQAGMLCDEAAFQAFLIERRLPYCALDAAKCVRTYCNVQSRSDINDHNPIALSRWRDLVAAYRAWQREPEIMG